MVNSTAAISLVLLVLLSLAIFLAVYYTGAGAGKSINGLGEFTIQINAPHGLNSDNASTGYNVGAYSNLKVDAKSGAITSWDFSAITSWEADGFTSMRVMSNGVSYEGYLTNGVLKVDRCEAYSQAALSSQVMGASFVAPSLLGVNADGTKTFSAVMRGKTYTVITAADGTPVSASTFHEDFTVTSFDANANTLVLPTIDQNGIVCTNFAVEEKREYNMLSVEAQNVAESQKFWSEQEKEEHAALLVSKKLAAMQPASAQSCPVSWRGDGFCDVSCNNAASNYDNGDCCAGDCQATSRFACEGALECKDPKGNASKVSTQDDCPPNNGEYDWSAEDDGDWDPNSAGGVPGGGNGCYWPLGGGGYICPGDEAFGIAIPDFGGDGSNSITEYQQGKLDTTLKSTSSSKKSKSSNGVSVQDYVPCGLDDTPVFAGSMYNLQGGTGWAIPMPAPGGGYTTVPFKHCAALHGAGLTGPRPSVIYTSVGEVPLESGESYFGHVQYYQYPHTCSHWKAPYGQTDDYGWPDLQLQEAWFSVASWASVRMCHSMGNNLLQGHCLMNNICSVKWYADEAPMKGSSSVTLGYVLYVFGGFHDWMHAMFRAFPFPAAAFSALYTTCNMTTSMQWGGIFSHNHARWDDATAFSGTLAGHGWLGSGGVGCANMIFLGGTLWAVFGVKSDGAVNTEGEDVASKSQSDNENGRWYQDEINHMDGRGGNGDWDPYIGSDGFPNLWQHKAIGRGA